jgi:hypothetical protein
VCGAVWCVTVPNLVSIRDSTPPETAYTPEAVGGCSKGVYAVDDFGFEEEGAVLGCANEFVNHSR